MEKSNKLTRALKAASEEGIDLTQLHERLSLTPTERLWKNFRMAAVVEQLRKAVKNTVTESDIEKLLGRAKDLRVLPELEALLEIRKREEEN